MLYIKKRLRIFIYKEKIKINMTTIKSSDLLQPTEKTIKNWNCSFIAVEGANVLDKLSLEDLAIPYESQYRSRVILNANTSDVPLIYGFIGKSVTFLMIKVTYDSTNDPYYQYEQEKYNITYYFEDDPIERPLNRLMILTGSADEKIPQIYLNNPLGYDVTLDILQATTDTEYDGVESTGFQPSFNITNTSGLTYTGTTTDEYIRFSGTTETGNTYSLYLPSAVGSGNVLIVKNISNDILTIFTQTNESIDNSMTSEALYLNDVLRLIDASVGNWDKI